MNGVKMVIRVFWKLFFRLPNNKDDLLMKFGKINIVQNLILWDDYKYYIYIIYIFYLL